MIALLIRRDHLSDARIASFLVRHPRDMHATSPRESVRALDLDQLQAPGVHFWSAWAPDDALVGTGALKLLGAGHAELKSMRTDAARRGGGSARQLLRFLMAQARGLGVQRLSLETGSQDFFIPARGLYPSEGFAPCGPFGGYAPGPNSCFFTRAL